MPVVIAVVTGIAIGAVGSRVVSFFFHRNDNNTTKTRRSSIIKQGHLEMTKVVGEGVSLTPHVALESSSSLMSALLQQLWPLLNQIMGSSVKESLDRMFKENIPAPFNNMYVKKLDLGKEPIQLENFIVYPLHDNSLKLELEINWDSSCDVLVAGLPAGNTVGVKAIKLESKLVVVCRPLLNKAPVLSSAQVAFVNPPYINLDFTGLADIADWANIRPMVDKAIHDGLGASLVLPKRMFIPVDQACDFIQAYQRPIGILRVTLQKGRGFPILRNALRMKEIPDVCCALRLGDKVLESSVKKNTQTPEWNETMDFVVSDYGQLLKIQAHDLRMMNQKNDLGMVQCTVADLLTENKKSKELVLVPNMEGSKKLTPKENMGGKVTIDFDMLEFTDDISSIVGGSGTAAPYTMKGMVIVFVDKLENLPVKKEDAASYVKVICGGKEFKTAVISYDPNAEVAGDETKEEKKDIDEVVEGAHEITTPVKEVSLNPHYNAAFEIALNANEPPPTGIEFELMNGTSSLGSHTIPGNMFLAMKDELHEAKVNIGGAILYCGVQAFGVPAQPATEKDKPTVVGDEVFHPLPPDVA